MWSLLQNWFYVENMVLYYEEVNAQYFYDRNSNAFYIVSEGENGINIEEIQPLSNKWNTEFGRYLFITGDCLPLHKKTLLKKTNAA